MNRVEATCPRYSVSQDGAESNLSTCAPTLVNLVSNDVGPRSLPGKKLGKRKSSVPDREGTVSCPCNREHMADDCLRLTKRARKAELDVVDSQGNTSLGLAIKNGQFAEAERLVEAGANVLHVNDEGDNVLLLAAQNGHLIFLDWAGLSEVNLHHINHRGNNALMLAAANGHYDTLRWLTVMGINSQQCNENGDNALTLAAAAGHLSAVHWLLNGAACHITTPLDVNKENHQGNTALMLAARNDHLDVVRLLVNCHARVTGFNHQQLDALALAVQGGHLETAMWLVAGQLNIHQLYWDKSNIFHFAAIGGDLPTAQWLRRTGVSSDQINHAGHDPLSLAAQHGHLAFLEWLLAEKLCSVDRPVSVSGDSSLLIAVRNGYPAVVQRLFAYGADINRINNNGQSALTLATRSNQSLALWLCRNGADIHHVDNEGNSAFLLGARSGFVDLLQALERRRVDIHLVNGQGDNAFTLAAKSGSMAVARWLHERQVNIHQVNHRHFNALTQAVSVGCLPMVDWLRSLDVDCHQCAQMSCNNGILSFFLSPLALAVVHGHLALAERLRANYVLHHNDRSVLLLTAENGQLAALRWWYQQVVGSEDLRLPSLYPDLNTALALATVKGHLPVIQWLYRQGASLNTLTDDKTTLMLAVQSGNLAAVKWFYQRGVDLHHVNVRGDNALNLAAMAGDWAIVQWLLSKNMANLANGVGNDALALATQNGCVSVVKRLAQDYDLNQRDYRGNNLVMQAFGHGHMQLGIWFCHKGVDIYSINQDGNNILLLAAKQGDLPTVMWLCEQNVDVHQVNYFGDNALMLAAAGGHLSVVRWLYESKEVAIDLLNNDECNALELAAVNGHLHVVQWLENKSLMLSVYDAGRAILFAAENGQRDMLQWFRQRQYSLEYDGDSAFLCAVANNNLPLAKWCYAQDVTTPFLVINGNSCFTMACENGNLPMLQWLCQQFGGVVGTDEVIPGTVFSMLGTAANTGKLHIMQWLATQGIDPLVRQPPDEDEPIFFAVRGGHLHIVKWLHEQGADLNQREDDGDTLLTSAIRCGHLLVVEWLYQQGIALHEVGLNSLDALSLAIRNDHIELAQWISRHGCVLTPDHLDIMPRTQSRRVIRALYQALPSQERTMFICGLNLERQQRLLQALNVNCPENPSEEQLAAAFARFDGYSDGTLKQQSLLAVARIIRNKHTTWPTASDSLRQLTLPQTLKYELQQLLETQLFP